MSVNNLSDEHNSDDDDEETGVANHLLDIREGAQWEYNNINNNIINGNINIQRPNTNEFTNDEEGKPISTPQIYEPKFLEIYNAYKRDRSPIDLNSHLLALSIEHLIPFCCWARDSYSKCNWIRTTLQDNVDLRPEVRNGLAMIFIYSFSSAKAIQQNSDMFLTLQDSESGLGIVNKTSLKIYNDPYGYFNFLKSCISGLIDAGAIPENERLNQPKKPKRQSENKEELTAYLQLKGMVITMVLRNEIIPLRSKIQQILSVWLNRNKGMRSRKFSTALNILAGNSGPYIGGYPVNNVNPYGNTVQSVDFINRRFRDGTNDSIDSTTGLLSLAAAGAVAYSNDDNSMIQLGFPTNNNNYINQSNPRIDSNTSSYSNLITLENKDNESIEKANKIPRLSTNNLNNNLNINTSLINNPNNNNNIRMNQVPSLKSVPTLIFERVGLKEWDIKENRIYDIYSFLSVNSSSICLIDENKITEDEKNNKKLISNLNGFVSLQSEFLSRNGLLTSWPKKEYPQLKCLVETFLYDNNITLANLWLGESLSNRFLIKLPSTMKGILCYEIVTQVGILLRSCVSLGLTMDCWRVFYPKDLNNNTLDISFGIFLTTFFPQAKVILQSSQDNGVTNNLSSIIVKYFPHTSKQPIIQPPLQEKPEMYQTLGTLDELASTVLGRLDPSVTFHDFLIKVNELK